MLWQCYVFSVGSTHMQYGTRCVKLVVTFHATLDILQWDCQRYICFILWSSYALLWRPHNAYPPLLTSLTWTHCMQCCYKPAHCWHHRMFFVSLVLRAVQVLKASAKTDHVHLEVARDARTRYAHPTCSSNMAWRLTVIWLSALSWQSISLWEVDLCINWVIIIFYLQSIAKC